MSNFYPICLNLQHKKCLVVGGGKVAARKVRSLLAHGASVTVISPAAEEEIHALAREGEIEWLRRQFGGGDAAGYTLAIGATDDDAVNRHLSEECRAERVFVNIVDEPSLCDFIVPAVVRRGNLTVSVATDGKSPLLARRIRERLEREFGVEYADFLALMGEVRNRARRDVDDPEERRRIYTEIVDSDVLKLLGEGQHNQVKERIESVFAGRRIKP